DKTRRKLVIFNEHRDTLRYLEDRVRGLLGRPEAVVTIHGGMGRDDRRKAQESFMQDKTVEILLATDAAGEGINLQRAHLMVNYDLPWNPNRLEQRFGRIHRIGQTEVCHLWNLVATETREGEVYGVLLKKLEQERSALQGRVFDVLGKLTFGEGQTLRDLLVEAIRKGESPEVRARLTQAVAGALDDGHIRSLLEDRALYQDKLDVSTVRAIGEEMARADARRLQPHFISAFFLEAFKQLGGTVREREPRRYEISRVPGLIRQRDRQIGIGAPVLERYERITFERPLRSLPGKPPATFTAPGHPLLDATIDVILERYSGLLKQGGVLVDDADGGEAIRALFYLEHKVQDGRIDANGNPRVVSHRMQFVEIDGQGEVTDAGSAPYLDYRPITAEERDQVAAALEAPWLTSNLEKRAIDFAADQLVPAHVAEVRDRKEKLIDRTLAAVHDRLTKEIIHWDHRATTLRQREEAGKTSKINSARAAQRGEDLRGRMQRRKTELARERMIRPLPPVVTGGLLIVPGGLLDRLQGERHDDPATFARETAHVERVAMETVMMRERALGYEPRDVSAARVGYDVESRVPGELGRLRFIEVKGRIVGAKTVTVTKNEILTALNKPNDFILAIVEVEGDYGTCHYIERPFHREPDFGATSVNYNLKDLLNMERATAHSTTPPR
ncbi:MAG: helicase-related protein, partial [Thermomicrobiales bacterium]